MIGKSWTPEQQQLMNDLKNRLTDRICDIADDVLKPYALAHMGFGIVEWSVHMNFWLDRAGRTTRVTFDGTSTKQDLDRSLLSSMQRIDLKREIPSWRPDARALANWSLKSDFGWRVPREIFAFYVTGARLPAMPGQVVVSARMSKVTVALPSQRR